MPARIVPHEQEKHHILDTLRLCKLDCDDCVLFVFFAVARRRQRRGGHMVQHDIHHRVGSTRVNRADAGGRRRQNGTTTSISQSNYRTGVRVFHRRITRRLVLFQKCTHRRPFLSPRQLSLSIFIRILQRAAARHRTAGKVGTHIRHRSGRQLAGANRGVDHNNPARQRSDISDRRSGSRTDTFAVQRIVFHSCAANVALVQTAKTGTAARARTTANSPAHHHTRSIQKPMAPIQRIDTRPQHETVSHRIFFLQRRNYNRRKQLPAFSPKRFCRIGQHEIGAAGRHTRDIGHRRVVFGLGGGQDRPQENTHDSYRKFHNHIPRARHRKKFLAVHRMYHRNGIFLRRDMDGNARGYDSAHAERKTELRI